jgi:DNA polymerase IV
MAADVWAWCEKAGTYGRTVTVKAKFADFHRSPEAAASLQ